MLTGCCKQGTEGTGNYKKNAAMAFVKGAEERRRASFQFAVNSCKEFICNLQQGFGVTP